MSIEDAIERTITLMWNRYADPLSLEELAATAMFSKFYYARAFRDVTGTSPGRFLSAVRLFMAKRYLLETPASVTEISFRVGYNSLGTFTSRFAHSVGVPPTKYRTMGPSEMPLVGLSTARMKRYKSTVSGKIRVAGAADGFRIYVAAFKSPVVEGMPASFDILDDAGTFRLGVPDGRWFVRAAAVAKRDAAAVPRIRTPLLTGAARPVEAVGGRHYTSDVHLRPVTPFDLPILLALPELDGRQRAPLELAT